VLQQGLQLLVYGMGTVVVFLTALVFATRLMSGVVLRWFAPPATQPTPVATGTDPSPAVLAAITAAVHRYRQERR